VDEVREQRDEVGDDEDGQLRERGDPEDGKAERDRSQPRA